jgi:hypothetical protein
MMNKISPTIHWVTAGAMLAVLAQLPGCAVASPDENVGEGASADVTPSGPPSAFCSNYGTPGWLAAAEAFADLNPDAATPYTMHSPDNNVFGSPASISWGSMTGQTEGASLFTLALEHSDPTITSSVVYSWWSSASPTSYWYYKAVAASNHFTQVGNIANVVPGDLFAIWTSSAATRSGGHSMIVETCPQPIDPIAAKGAPAAATQQYIMGVVDSTSTAHGCTINSPQSDSRWVPSDPAHPCLGGATDGGAGHAFVRVFTDLSGNLVGYAWSTVANTQYYAVDYNSIYTPSNYSTLTTLQTYLVGRFHK